MNITSLLQEAPSIDRTRRNKSQWDDSLPSSAGTTSKGLGLVEDGQAGVGGQSRSFQVMNEYIHPSQRDTTLFASTQTSNQSGYVKAHEGKEKQMTGTEGYKKDYQYDPLLATRQNEIIHSPTPNLAVSSNLQHNDTLLVTNGLPALFPPPRTPSPSLDPVHLGTFIYPSLPFPIHPESLPFNRRTTLTVLVPSSFLPRHASSTTDPRSRNIWGGIPFGDERKMYTDDSDIVFAAIHAGVIPYDEKLFATGKDLRLELRIYQGTGYGRFVGGNGEAGLTSGSWGNSHEGCAFRIMSARWVPPHTARSYTRQNRKARMAEYAQRRGEVMNTTLASPSSLSSNEEVPSIMDAFKPPKVKAEVDPIEQEITSLTLSGGWQQSIGFKYAPMSLYLMLFAFNPNARVEPPPTKRRKLDTSTVTPTPMPREIILRMNAKPKERIVLVPKVHSTSEGLEPMQVDSQPNELGEVVYDMFSETQPIREGLKDPSAAINAIAESILEQIKGKGVRFAETEKEQWNRELLHADLGVKDIVFDMTGVAVQDVLYEVNEWTWRATGEERREYRWRSGKRKVGKGKKRVKKSANSKIDAHAPASEVTTEKPSDGITEPTVDKSKGPSPAGEEKEEGELSG